MLLNSLTLALGNRSLRCPTSCIHAVVSRGERGLALWESFGSDPLKIPKPGFYCVQPRLH
jgi:hypothetical protein